MIVEKTTSKCVPGEVLGHYRIIEKIGSGGMGDVYRARDEHLDCDVAIKVLPPSSVNDQSRKRFHKEARALSRLNHPNIAIIHDFDNQQGLDFLVMEYIPGISLSEKLAGGNLTENQVIALGLQLAEGLAVAHEHGIVHSDLKPDNLRVTDDGRLKILDFGLAKLPFPALMTSATTEGSSEAQGIAGTLHYMAPEQLTGSKIDAPTDIYAAGEVLYEMATGKHPFAEVERAQLIGAILRQVPRSPRELNPQLSVELGRIIGKCLEKEAENRYQSAKELAIDLRRLHSGIATGLQPAISTARGVSVKLMTLGLGILSLLVALLVMFSTGSWRQHSLDGANIHRIESVAVLPLKNFSGDPAQDFFADGMTDALISGLADIKAIKVISRTSVMHYKGSSETLPQIARELRVDAIVEASVMRSGDRLRVTAQLIDAQQDRHLWANKYERKMTDVLALQSELVQAIAGELKVQLTSQETERFRATRPVDPEAFDDTLKGRAIIEHATGEEQVNHAIELFQKAVDRDPTYAPAWAGLGQAQWALAMTGFEFVAPGEVRDRAIAAAEKALQLDPTLPEANEARALIAVDGEWDIEKAQEYFEKALKLRPGYAAIHNWYGGVLGGLPLRRFEEARQHFAVLRELDPLSPWNDASMAAWWLYQGRPEKALEDAERASQRNPTLWIIHWQIGFARLNLGQPGLAAPEFEKALRLLHPNRPASVLSPLALAYGLAGHRTDAVKILAEMKAASRERYISPYYLGVVYSGLGQKDKAFTLLEQALNQRTPYLIYCVPDDPLSIALRRDPRWRYFVSRLRALVRLPPGTADPYS